MTKKLKLYALESCPGREKMYLSVMSSDGGRDMHRKKTGKM